MGFDKSKINLSHVWSLYVFKKDEQMISFRSSWVNQEDTKAMGWDELGHTQQMMLW